MEPNFTLMQQLMSAMHALIDIQADRLEQFTISRAMLRRLVRKLIITTGP